MTTHQDPPQSRPHSSDDPTVKAVEEERGGISDASLDPGPDDVPDTPDPSLTDEAAEVEAHPS